jgi:acyl carrier protein
VTLARPDARGDKQLIAYVVGPHHQLTASEELREYLKDQLPEYMIPAKIVTLPKLPLNANGKVDRRNLPDPEELIPQTADFTAPRNEIEIGIVRIWAELLGREKIGIRENFFELGGHSLIAIQATSRMRQQFRVPLEVEAVFDHPTVEELAVVVAAAEGLEAEAEIVPIPRRRLQG